MLKRINRITNVGCFRNSRASQFQFEPLTFIYGENCNGKSTLCDILRSLSENNPLLISNRISIPRHEASQNQHVTFNFLLPNNNSESPINFETNTWANALTDIEILVFDSNFIHRNVFTGLSIERRNHENVTQFILGEQSVIVANQIATQNSNLRAIKRDINNIERDSFSNISNVNNFIRMQVIETEEQIKSTILNNCNEINNKNITYNNIDPIFAYTEPFQLNNIISISDIINEFNILIAKSYEVIHSNAREIIIRHIESNCNQNPNAEKWINEGLNIMGSDNCPFCGQDITDTAQRFIDTYKEYFDIEFNNYTNEMKNSLAQYNNQLNNISNITLIQYIHQNTLSINRYSDLNSNNLFFEKKNIINETGIELESLVNNWNETFISFRDSINNKIVEKSENLYVSITPITSEELIALNNQISFKVTEYNNLITSINEIIHTYKTSLNAQLIRNQITQLNEQNVNENLKLNRIVLNSKCLQYQDLVTSKLSVEQEITRLNSELETQQTTFLTQYFTEINSIISRIGSENFQIEQNINRRGNMPVIQLTAKYCNTSITNEQLSYTLSESDRRALAFSIFWAKIHHMSTNARQKTIIVLDDPITSFDEGRIDRTIRHIERYRSEVRQLIIMSHYPNYIKNYFLRVNNQQIGIALYKISKDANTVIFNNMYISDFIETIHQQKFRKIIDFIDRRTQEDIFSDLRVFIETEIRYRFWMQINRLNINSNNFNDLLITLRDSRIISNEIWHNVDQLRQTLNTDHHVWLERTQNEKIGIAQDVIRTVYEEI